MKYTDNEIENYIRLWYDNKSYSDLNLFLDKGYLDLAIRLIVESGAIDPDICYEEFRDIETQIIKMAMKINKKSHKKQLDQCLKNVQIWVNDANEHYFIDKDILQ